MKSLIKNWRKKTAIYIGRFQPIHDGHFEIIKKAGSWFSYDETKLGQGRDAVKTLLLDNPELMEELEIKIKDCIKALAEA